MRANLPQRVEINLEEAFCQRDEIVFPGSFNLQNMMCQVVGD